MCVESRCSEKKDSSSTSDSSKGKRIEHTRICFVMGRYFFFLFSFFPFLPVANDSDTVIRSVYCVSRVVVSVNHTRSMETTRNCRNREIESCRVHNFGGKIKNNETTKEIFFFFPPPSGASKFPRTGNVEWNETLESFSYPSKLTLNFIYTLLTFNDLEVSNFLDNFLHNFLSLFLEFQAVDRGHSYACIIAVAGAIRENGEGKKGRESVKAGRVKG